MFKEYQGNWTMIIDEYNRLTGVIVEPRRIANAHYVWRKKNLPPSNKGTIKCDLKVINNLVHHYGNNWHLTHQNYCKITKTDISLKTLRQAYNRSKSKQDEIKENNKRKHDDEITEQFEISDYEILKQELEADVATKINPVIDFSNNADSFIKNFDKSCLTPEFLTAVAKLDKLCLKIKEINKF